MLLQNWVILGKGLGKKWEKEKGRRGEQFWNWQSMQGKAFWNPKCIVQWGINLQIANFLTNIAFPFPLSIALMKQANIT